MKRINRFLILTAALSCGIGLRAQVPQVIGYQGKVVVGGVPWTGTGQFKFALVDGAGTTTYWSNDGTSAAGGQPTSAVSLSVANGLFNVGLGDTSFAHMTQVVPYSVFANSDVRLRTWFNDGTHGFQRLIPDQRIFAAGYAMYAANMSSSSTVNGSSLDIGSGSIASGTLASVAGGQNNTASGGVSIVGGGSFNTASGASSFVGGGGGSPLHLGNTACGDYSAVAGGIGNSACGFAAFIGGGGWDSVGAPLGNVASGAASTVSGGLGNQATNTHAAVAGGFGNIAGGTNATVGGGSGNIAESSWATIAGGLTNTIQDTHGYDDLSSIYSAIGGGCLNGIWAAGSVIAGGQQNTISYVHADSPGSGHFIGGGGCNSIRNQNYFSVIAGGYGNFVDSAYATVGGGSSNRIVWAGPTFGHCIAGGRGNTIYSSANDCTISGGVSNFVSGGCAVVPGGSNNVASGKFSFAAGTGAQAAHQGSFVWADAQSPAFASTAANQFLIRAAGGVGIGTATPDAALTVNGTADKPGGGSWGTYSDARLKKNVQPLSGVLDKLLRLHGVSFEYRDPQAIHELPGERIGIVAQEIEGTFPDWVDTGAQGYKRVTYRGFEALTVEALRDLRAEKDKEIDNLKRENASLGQRLRELEQTVRALAEQKGGRS